jgi:hypothetical protein
MPAHHQAFRDPKIMQRAAGIGAATAALIDALFAQRRHPEQAIRSAQGVLALARDHSASAVEAACARALALDAIGYGSVRRLLSMPSVQPPTPAPTITHEHIRGGDYYGGATAEVSHVA